MVTPLLLDIVWVLRLKQTDKIPALQSVASSQEREIHRQINTRQVERDAGATPNHPVYK